MSGPGRDLEDALRVTSPDLLAYLERRVAQREDAADLLGETMLQAWRRADTLPADLERRRMWLFTIAANVLANHRRSTRRRDALTERIRGVLRTTSAEAEPDERAAVRDAVRRLPLHQRELIMLVHWDHFTLSDAAGLLGVNASTARSRYAAARSALHSALGARVG